MFNCRFKHMRRLTASVIGALALLGHACSAQRADPRPKPVPVKPIAVPAPDPYLRVDSDEMLRFGAELAKAGNTERKAICRDLLRREPDHPPPGLALHLLVGRTLSKSCGDIGTVLRWVSAISKDTLPDDRTRWLVAKESAVLKELQRSMRAGAPGTARTPKPARVDCPPPQQDEASRLRQKLEEIRAIEKRLDAADPAK